MKRTPALLLILLSLLAAQESAAQGGYKGVIAPTTESAAPAAATTGNGYSGVTSWDSIVSGSLYDFINEAGQNAQGLGDNGNSAALAQMIRGKRQKLASFLAEKEKIEREREQEYFAQEKEKMTKAIEERMRQRELRQQ